MTDPGWAPPAPVAPTLLVVAGSLDTDLMLARWNLQRAERTLVEGASSGFDVAYLSTLSDDALPALDEPALDDAPLWKQTLRDRWRAHREHRHAHGWRALRGVTARW